jgi:hypothetical protein
MDLKPSLISTYKISALLAIQEIGHRMFSPDLNVLTKLYEFDLPSVCPSVRPSVSYFSAAMAKESRNLALQAISSFKDTLKKYKHSTFGLQLLKNLMR